jgi:uncharacterized protein with PIN domain
VIRSLRRRLNRATGPAVCPECRGRGCAVLRLTIEVEAGEPLGEASESVTSCPTCGAPRCRVETLHTEKRGA